MKRCGDELLYQLMRTKYDRSIFKHVYANNCCYAFMMHSNIFILFFNNLMIFVHDYNLFDWRVHEIEQRILCLIRSLMSRNTNFIFGIWILLTTAFGQIDTWFYEQVLARQTIWNIEFQTIDRPYSTKWRSDHTKNGMVEFKIVTLKTSIWLRVDLESKFPRNF